MFFFLKGSVPKLNYPKALKLIELKNISQKYIEVHTIVLNDKNKGVFVCPFRVLNFFP